MKKCICCGETKPIESFHKHKAMKDGHLNKCAVCVKEAVDAWRKKNPDCRKKEHARRREKEGHMTYDEWRAFQKKNAIGRKTASKRYSFKRRRYIESQVLSELDDLVLTEAFLVAEARTRLTGQSWHVDHIVPLFHKQACGLNNAFNIQVVPAYWNFKKNNKSMDTYWSGY